MPDVLLAYSIAALLVAIVFVVAILIGLALRGCPAVPKHRSAWSSSPSPCSKRPDGPRALGPSGSPAAVFNDLLFRVLLLVGFGFLFVSWTIAIGNRESPLVVTS